MSSNLACVGLDMEDEAALADLVNQLSPASISLGRLGAFEVARWEDASGARLLLELACAFEIDVCLGADLATVPAPGHIMAGEVFLVASLDHPQVETTHRRRRFLPWRWSN